VGSVLAPPGAEGGALRSQDLRTSGDPTGLDGTILRVDPATGAALADNPMASHADPNARRIVATGLRNPFRITARPGTSEIWIGDVGWGDWEEINRITDPKDALVENFGWPCYEGTGRQPGYDAADLAVCENLYAEGTRAVTTPYHKYHHNERVVPNESCPTGGSSVSGVAFQFYRGGSYPSTYDGALFFSDYSRDCIWVAFPGANGLPDMNSRTTFVGGAANPVDLQIGPGGDLFYVDFDGGTIRRVQYQNSSTTPGACPRGSYAAQYFNNMTLQGAPASTGCEASINYDWVWGSPNPAINADGFSARWTGLHAFAAGSYTFTARADDGIRLYVDGSLLIDQWRDQAATSYTANRQLTAGDHEVKVEYYENGGGAVAQVGWQLSTGTNTPPSVSIDVPAASVTWKVGDVIQFAGKATDAQDGALPATALSWALVLQHCPSTCHAHPLQTYPSVASGSFTAPDHEHPSHLELRLTATDSQGAQATATVNLQPQTTTLAFDTSPSGLQIAVNGAVAQTPFTRTVIVGSNNSISAISPQTLAGATYTFSSWSDQGAGTHNITAAAAGSNFVATYQNSPTTPVTLHVGDLDISATVVNKTGWKATVAITVHDSADAPVAGAVVTGSWTNGTSGTASCTTASNGQCSVTTAKIPTTQAGVTFTVTNVAGAGFTYAQSTNHDPDGDSTGTTISRARP
jgi:hypothetical protein